VEPGGDPLARLDWRFEPSLATLEVVDPGPRGAGLPGSTLVLLALAGSVAIAVVLAWPPRRADPSSPPTSLV
jgi:hypothetical protein